MPSVREEGAPHHGHLDHPEALDIGDEPGAPTEEAIVFDRGDPRTEVRGAAREPSWSVPRSLLDPPATWPARGRLSEAPTPACLAS